MRKPAEAGLFNCFELNNHWAKNAAFMAVVAHVLLNDRAALLAAILDDDAVR